MPKDAPLIVTGNPDGSVTVAPAANKAEAAEADAAADATLLTAPGHTVTEPVQATPGDTIPGTDVPVPPAPTTGAGDPSTLQGTGPATGDPRGDDAGAGVQTGPLGPSTEATVPGQADPAPPPSGSPTVTTAEPERVQVQAEPAPAPAPPEPPAERLAVGTHVRRLERTLPGPGEEARDVPGPEYGIILEAHIIPGATEPAYRVGWLDTAGGLLAAGQLVTTREAADLDGPEGVTA